jgi:hypothetical protein
MATKPVTIPEIWASNALYTTGPFIGSASKVVPAAAVAAEGHRPGALFPTPAEYENSQQNIITTWIATWVFAGSSTGAADAHIVESDSTGRSALVGLDLNDAVDETVLSVVGVNTIAPTAQFTCTTGATVVQAIVGNSTGTAFSASVGTGAGTGLDATLASSAAGGAGVRITTNGVCAADGIVVTCAAGHVGDGVIIDAAASGGNGLVVLGGTSRPAIDSTASGNQDAGQFLGSGLGSGVVADSGSTAGAAGVTAQALNNTGFGVQATVPVAATSAAAAVRAIGRGSGQGVQATAVNGVGVLTSASGVGGIALQIFGKVNDPTTVSNGALDYNTTTNTAVLANVAGGVYRDVQTSRGNMCTGGAVSGGVTTLGAAIWVTAATLTLTGGDAPSRSGRTLRLRFRCEARMTGAVATQGTLNLRIRDTTTPSTLLTLSGTGSADSAGILLDAINTIAWQRSVVVDVDYSPCPTGSLTFVAEIQALGGTDIRIRNVSLLPEGLF